MLTMHALGRPATSVNESENSVHPTFRVDSDLPALVVRLDRCICTASTKVHSPPYEVTHHVDVIRILWDSLWHPVAPSVPSDIAETVIVGRVHEVECLFRSPALTETHHRPRLLVSIHHGFAAPTCRRPARHADPNSRSTPEHSIGKLHLLLTDSAAPSEEPWSSPSGGTEQERGFDIIHWNEHVRTRLTSAGGERCFS
jgi:hypothetical protein